MRPCGTHVLHAPTGTGLSRPAILLAATTLLLVLLGAPAPVSAQWFYDHAAAGGQADEDPAAASPGDVFLVKVDTPSVLRALGMEDVRSGDVLKARKTKTGFALTNLRTKKTVDLE